MVSPLDPRAYLAHEARSLYARLAQVKPIAMHETMVPAAAASIETRAAIETFLAKGRRALAADTMRFLNWLGSAESESESAESLGKKFVLLRLRFHAMLAQFDIFSVALTQRSEHETGVWLAGLDVLARDGLFIEGGYFTPPPLICYLERGLGAAIRRAKTKLPGGDKNPIAVIRIPRERMVGSGIGASLLHEVGHQAAALIDWVPSMRSVLYAMEKKGGPEQAAWRSYRRWISEIVADVWAVGFLGITATLGLITTVTLPTPFAFRSNDDDPHPMPWARVKLSCAIGNALFPDPQWENLAALWEKFYPAHRQSAERRQQINQLLATMPTLVALLVEHRPKSLEGESIAAVLPVKSRSPAALRALLPVFARSPRALVRARPTLALAVIGQARADGQISAAAENKALSHLLNTWALRNATSRTVECAMRKRPADNIHLITGTFN